MNRGTKKLTEGPDDIRLCMSTFRLYVPALVKKPPLVVTNESGNRVGGEYDIPWARELEMKVTTGVSSGWVNVHLLD